MIGVAYASVPLYRLFCQVTGWGGTTQRAVEAPPPVPGKSISVRFDSNTSGGLPWLFRPEKTAVTVPIGGKQLAFYKAVNQSAASVTGTAVVNVSPDGAGKYFMTIERSEEHTSELQSLIRNSYSGFCLKKKTKTREKND